MLASTSRAPNSPFTVFASASTASLERTSSFSRLAALRPSSLFSSRSVAITLAPSAMKASAIARPIPWPAAVTSAVFPFNLLLTGPDLSVIVARHAVLGDAVIFDGGLQDHSVRQLIDHGALNFLPWCLACRITEAAASLQCRAPTRQLGFRDQYIGG